MQHLNASEIKPSPEKYSRGTSESSINSLNAQVDYKKSNTKTNPSEIDQTKSKIYQSASIR